MKYEPKIEKEFLCPLEYGLDIFGGKWKSRIICVLSANDVMRYGELRKELGNIADAVLASMLKQLLANNMINRIQYNEIAPKVEHSLTEKGRSILPILQSICVWSRENTTEELSRKLPPCMNCDQ